MPPSLEEESRHPVRSEFGRGRLEDTMDEKRRPPLYNAEDYASSLKEWTRRGAWEAVCGSAGSEVQETVAEDDPEKRMRAMDMETSSSGGREMSLREFSSVSHLLGTLAQDLQFALPSFVQEFVGDPLDGASLLLELLRIIQQSRRRAPSTPAPPIQRPLHAIASARASTASSTTSSIASSTAIPPRYGRRRSSSANPNSTSSASSVVGGGPTACGPFYGALYAGGLAQDERTCLECLRCCVRRAPDAAWRLAESSAGLHTVAIAIMSASTQTRVAALEVLTKVCEMGSRNRSVSSSSAYSSVSEALSSTRLSLGEPARFHFLVSMMSSLSGAPDLTPAALKFVNAFLEASPGPQERVFTQAELQHAGFSPDTILAVMPQIGAVADEVRSELRRWKEGYLDVAVLPERLETAERETVSLREKVTLLERKIQILQEEKGVLQSLERCLKDRCCRLEDEVSGLRSVERSSPNPLGDVGVSTPVKGSVSGILAGGGSGSVDTKHHASTPEDEGISSTDNPSSSCSAGEDEDGETRQASRRADEEAERIMYETFAVQSETLLENHQARKGREEEEETTIEEVIRELRDLVDDEEAARREAEMRSKAQRGPSGMRMTDVITQRGPMIAGRPFKSETRPSSPPAAPRNTSWIGRGTDSGWTEEPEIVPTRILPQPPRRPRSLARAAVKNTVASAPFFEDESSGQSSDSDERPTNAAPVVQAKTVVSGYSRAYGLRRWETVVAGPADGMGHKTNQLNQKPIQQQLRYNRESPPKVLRRSESMHHGNIPPMPERWTKRMEAIPSRGRYDSRRGSLDDGLFFVAENPTIRPSPPSAPRPSPPPKASPPRQQLPFAARARKSRSLERMDDDEGTGGDWSLGWDFPRGRPPLSRSATRRANPPPSLTRRNDSGTDRSSTQQQRCPPDGASSAGGGQPYGGPHSIYGVKSQQGIYGVIGVREDGARTQMNDLRRPNRNSQKPMYSNRGPPQSAAKVTDLLSGLY